MWLSNNPNVENTEHSRISLCFCLIGGIHEISGGKHSASKVPRASKIFETRHHGASIYKEIDYVSI